MKKCLYYIIWWTSALHHFFEGDYVIGVKMLLDTLSAVKLHFAVLQYPAIEFYSLSQSGNQSRILLIALAWLLGTQDVLSVALRTRLINGPMGAECSSVNMVDPTKVSIYDRRY